MVSIDILLLIPVIMGAYTGYKRGVLVEIIGILAFVLAIFLGFRFLGLSMDFVSEFIGESLGGRMLPYLSFLLIFFPSIYAINKIGWIFRKALRITFLGMFDGLAGAALGAVQWFFGLSVLIWIGSAIGVGIPDRFLVDSEVYPFLESFAPIVVDKVSGYLPSMGEVFDKFNELGEMYKANN
ncbi:MAG: membrane protein required for colicin V production [Arcticibacterium sp.]|jgi:membrane protein required for colicin V production